MTRVTGAHRFLIGCFSQVVPRSKRKCGQLVSEASLVLDFLPLLMLRAQPAVNLPDI
jgi:hypothetical protein